MRTDLDALMQAYDIDALLITGAANHNPPMVYFTGGVHISNADLVKVRGKDPVLFHISMERDEALKTGLVTKNLDNYRMDELLEQANGNLVKATVNRYQKMFAELGITHGRVAIYGQIDAGAAFAIFTALQQATPGLEIVSELGNTVLLEAMLTKGMDEVERIRRMGKITVEVVGQVADFLTSHRVEDQHLVKPDGKPLTIGDVKSRINLWLAERGAENPEGAIFAMGRDAGVPHSAGTASDVVGLGKTIVFDIYPCEGGGGYFYDLTRTWCLGYATDEALALYEDVSGVYHRVLSELRVGKTCKEYQKLTCELFEALGHSTVKSNPTTREGYVHGLGHGLGLHVHERPWFQLSIENTDLLAPGAVVTVEPGLYYPERDLGVRLEDTIWVRPDGQFEVLADYPHDMILPMRQ